MLKNYFLLAVRNFQKHRNYAFMNLVGLGISLAAVLLIVAYIRFELSYDNYYSNAGRAYQLLLENQEGGRTQRTMSVPEPLGITLRNEYPEVEAATTFTQYPQTFRHNNELISIKTTVTTASWFSIFNLPFVYGNAASALARTDNMVISETLATKLFSKENPLGKTITAFQFDGTGKTYTISAVIKDIPLNSHFSLEAIVPVSETTDPLDFNAYSSAPQYLLLKPHASVDQLYKKLTAFYKKYNVLATTRISLLPVTDIRLHAGKIEQQTHKVSDIRFIYIFGAIALLILSIASINYINLTTARSMQRFKEVGMRKVMGANKRQLIIQFISESFLLFCLAIPFALLLAYLAWPAFSSYLQISPDTSYLFNPFNLLLLAVISTLTGILAGIYPAFFLSFKLPVVLFKGSSGNQKVNFSLRKTLIVVQFSISALLIIATLIVKDQLHMLNNRPLGFDKDNLVILPHTGYKNGAAATAFKQDLLSQSGIRSVSISSLNMGKWFGSSSNMDDPADSTRQLSFAFIDADFDFLHTINATLLQGRTFSATYPADKIDIAVLYGEKEKAATPEQKDRIDQMIRQQSLIVSESVVKALQLKRPLDSTIHTGALQGTIVGITKDILALTLKEVSPMAVFRVKQNATGYVYVRIDPNNTPKTIELLRTKWQQYFPKEIFDFEFSDTRLQKLYEAEDRLASLFTTFALLAICLSVLGLFSLTALLLKQKTKEIGIRKVMGATLLDLSKQFSKDFIALIGIAIIIASPIAWWGMHTWLQDYAHRIEISWWIFPLTGLTVLLVALVTVNLQIMKASRVNPVESLRTE